MKNKIILAVVLILPLALLSGCIEGLFQFTNNTSVITDYEWIRSDEEVTINFDEDKTGVILQKNGDDAFFTWTLDPSQEDTMIWTIQDTQESRVVKYYLVNEDTRLVLEWGGTPYIFTRK